MFSITILIKQWLNLLIGHTQDNSVKFWQLQNPLLVVSSLTFSADEKSLVSVSGDRTAIIWNLPKIFATNELDYACN